MSEGASHISAAAPDLWQGVPVRFPGKPFVPQYASSGEKGVSPPLRFGATLSGSVNLGNQDALLSVTVETPHLGGKEEEVQKPAEEEEAAGQNAENSPADLAEVEFVQPEEATEKPEDVSNPEFLLDHLMTVVGCSFCTTCVAA
jgi:hypothetical protein